LERGGDILQGKGETEEGVDRRKKGGKQEVTLLKETRYLTLSTYESTGKGSKL